mmetsp:Transcript_33449/g.106022  ORF Transcript_33449/g.106022 Transcript_33449/m.106022 type:complete len:224 (+) Transcript_33449:108-779(+)
MSPQDSPCCCFSLRISDAKSSCSSWDTSHLARKSRKASHSDSGAASHFALRARASFFFCCRALPGGGGAEARCHHAATSVRQLEASHAAAAAAASARDFTTTSAGEAAAAGLALASGSSGPWTASMASPRAASMLQTSFEVRSPPMSTKTFSVPCASSSVQSALNLPGSSKQSSHSKRQCGCRTRHCSTRSCTTSTPTAMPAWQVRTCVHSPKEAPTSRTASS